MDRFINIDRVAAVRMTTPEENPLVTDSSRMMDVWFDGPVIRKQLFRKVSKSEQEALVTTLLGRGFVRSDSLLLNPDSVLFAEMEHRLVGGIVTIGYGENGKPVEIKVGGDAFDALAATLRRRDG